MTSLDESRQAILKRLGQMDRNQYLALITEATHGELEPKTMSEDPTLAEFGLSGLETAEIVTTQPMFASEDSIPLNAYLASALTNLDEQQREHIFELSDLVDHVCRRFHIDLYQPRSTSDPVHHPNLSDSEVFHRDRTRVAASDLLIFLAHHPSFGAGEELQFAFNSLIPILVIHHDSSKVSRMVTGIPGTLISIPYREIGDLSANLTAVLDRIRPQLVGRKLAFQDFNVNIVGDRIRRLRLEQGFTREDVARVAAVSADHLERLETSSDTEGNPSLVHLRKIASALNTTVAELVEPELDDLMHERLDAWIYSNRAARFGVVSRRDRNKILRRMLLRIIDSLEDDDE